MMAMERKIIKVESKSKKKVFHESALPDKPFLSLRLSEFTEMEAYEVIRDYLFNCDNTPGDYMHPKKPNLNVELHKQTDKMFITIMGMDGNRRIIMNPPFLERINIKELSGNIFDSKVLKRDIVEKAIENLREDLFSILMFFLNPTTKIEKISGVPKKEAVRILSNVPRTREKRLKKAIHGIINEIVIEQEGLRR